MKLSKFKVTELTLDPENARKHSQESLASIAKSLQKFGQQKPIVVSVQGTVKTVIAGNGTLMAAMQLGLPTLYGIATNLTGEALAAYGVTDNRTAELSSWDTAKLLETLQGFSDQSLLEACAFDEVAMDKLLADAAAEILDPAEDPENPYSRKIEAPIYKPTGECPEISELVDSSKSLQLQEEILEADLPEPVRDFLLVAAQRHRVFNFEQIAEYYCHADAKTQALMERSACVIIDFDKAIENGYVQLGEKLSALYGQEYPAGSAEADDAE